MFGEAARREAENGTDDRTRQADRPWGHPGRARAHSRHRPSHTARPARNTRKRRSLSQARESSADQRLQDPGAANAIARLSDEERERGVWTVSAGNAGQGVAYAARAFGIPCAVVAIETAPQTKLDRMRALGARIVPVSYETAWSACEAHAFEGMDGTFVHPFDNHDFIAGHGVMGLEIVEDLPDVQFVIAAIGGGGLITGVGSAIKALRPGAKVLGAEPETAAPYAYSLDRGGPQIFPDWQASFVDGAGGKSVTERMWQRMQAVVDGTITVTLDQTREAMRLMAEKARVISEGAGALALAAALTGEAGDGPIVCVVSGGNIDLAKFTELVSAR